MWRGHIPQRRQCQLSLYWVGFYWAAYDLWRPHTPECRQCQHSLHWVLLGSISPVQTSYTIVPTIPALSALASTGEHMLSDDLMLHTAHISTTLMTTLY